MDNESESVSSPSVGDSTVVACRNGDVDAWTRVHARMESSLKRIAHHGMHKDLRGKVGVSDLVQDTFLLAHRSSSQFRGSSWGEMIAWLKSILKNQTAKAVRRHKWAHKRALNREVRLHEMSNQDSPILDNPTPSQILVAEEEREILDRALSQLSLADQELIIDHYINRMSYAEIAQRTARNEPAVRKHWSRAMIRWKQAADALQEPSR
jgi:RNA polymerase sigma-70 factor (ECF subfamily)